MQWTQALLDRFVDTGTLSEEMCGVARETPQKYAIYLVYCWWHGQMEGWGMVGSAKLPRQFEVLTFTQNICFLCRESCDISTFIRYRILFSFVCEHHVHFVLAFRVGLISFEVHFVLDMSHSAELPH
jgi:hypothetical protein